MAEVKFEDLLSTGAHFGHVTRKWDPNFKPYILLEKNGVRVESKKDTIIIHGRCELKKGGIEIKTNLDGTEDLNKKKEVHNDFRNFVNFSLNKRLEIIRDSLSDTDSRWGIEGTMSDISELMSDIDNLGIKEKNETNR